MFSKYQQANNLFFVLHSYIRDSVIQKHENCITRIQIKEIILFIKRIKSNSNISKQFRRKYSQNLKRHKSQTTVSKSTAHNTSCWANSICFNFVDRERDYSSKLIKKKSRISNFNSFIEDRNDNAKITSLRRQFLKSRFK